MAGIFGGSGSNNAAPAINARIQSSVQGRPRNIGAGLNRVAGNLIWYADFTSTPATSGGKGAGGSGKGTSGSYNYSASFIVSFGESVAQFNTIFNGNQIDFLVPPSAQVLADLATLGIVPTYNNTYSATFLLGDYAQSPWSYLVSAHPSQALAYRGEALMCLANLGLSSSPSLPNFTAELLWPINSDIPALGPDANPADWVTAFLTNADWGAGFPAALLGDMTAYKTWCRATGMLISPVLTNQQAANSHLGEIMKGTVADFVWSSGLLTIAPYADASVTGNGYTYTAPVTPLYDIGVNDYLENQGSLGSASGKSPIAASRKDPSQVLNRVQVEYLDRSNLYNPVTIYDSDDASIIANNRLRLSDLRAHHFFCLGSAASKSASLQMQREKVVTEYQFTLPATFILVEPIRDILTLTEPNLGLNRFPVRPTEIIENSDHSLTFTCEEFLGAVGPPLYARQMSLGTARNNNADPGPINTPIIFEPTDELGNGLEIWMAVSGQDPALWGGCNVFGSYDPAGTFDQLGSVNGPARMGVTTALLPTIAENLVGQTIDSANTLSVSLVESAGALASGSPADMTGLNTACFIDGEIISYQTATLTGPNAYGLAPMVRGAYGSTIGAHASGSAFARLDKMILQSAYTQDRIGSTIYLKFQSFNIYGGGLQDLSTLGAVAYTITGAALASPLPQVANIRTVFDSGFMRLYWDEINDFRSGIRYKIRKGTSFEAGIEVADVAHPGFVVFGNDTFWVVGYCQPAPGLIVYSESPTSITISGNMLVQNIIRESDQQAEGWPGTFTSTAKEGTDPTAVIRLDGAASFLGLADFLGTADLLNAGGIAAAGTYEISAADIVDIGYVSNAPINITWTGVGSPAEASLLAVSDFLGLPDFLGSESSAFVDIHPEIAVDANPSTGAFGAWQKFVPGVYTGRRFKFRLVLSTMDSETIAYALSFIYQVTVPGRIDHFQNLSVGSGGMAITYWPDGAFMAAPFNGGPDLAVVPYINVSWPGQTGDYYTLTSSTLAGVTIQFFNSVGTPVARTGVNVTVEGY